MAEEYLLRMTVRARPCRFDVVAVRSPDGGSPEITVIRNAF
jgi:hypothetical protein